MRVSLLSRPSSLKVRVAIGIAVSAALIPVAAHAVVGGFNDVPDGHTHASGIQWVADNDITSGCTPTTYCPDASVTRAQMATFMQRLAGHAAGVAPSVDAATLGGLTAAEVAALGGGGGAPVVTPFGFASGPNATETTGAFVALPGATANLTIPGGFTGTAVLSFTAESSCYGGTGFCNVRILVDGVEAAPAVGTDFAFNSTDSNTETVGSWESHAVQRVVTGLAPGNHTVQVQYGTTGTSTLRLDDWSLTATAHLS